MPACGYVVFPVLTMCLWIHARGHQTKPTSAELLAAAFALSGFMCYWKAGGGAGASSTSHAGGVPGWNRSGVELSAFWLSLMLVLMALSFYSKETGVTVFGPYPHPANDLAYIHALQSCMRILLWVGRAHICLFCNSFFPLQSALCRRDVSLRMARVAGC